MLGLGKNHVCANCGNKVSQLNYSFLSKCWLCVKCARIEENNEELNIMSKTTLNTPTGQINASKPI